MLAPGIPVFICGHPKSGTTLLTALLDGHSQLMVFPEETFYLDKLAHQPDLTVEAAAKWLLEQSACKRLALGKVESELDGNFDYSSIDFGVLQERFWANAGAGSQTHARMLESLIAAYADFTDQAGKRYWVEKTPGNERYLHRLLRWYPNLRAIYLVRDPRDIYVSYVRKKQIESDGKATLPVENFACRWGLSVWTWRRFAARYPTCHLVRYEDLLRYPENTLKFICHFLDIDYEAALERPTKTGKLWRGNSMHGDEFTGISTAPIGRWQNRLTQDLLISIEDYLGKAMVSLGYRLVTEPSTFWQVVRRWFRHRQKRKQILGMLIRLYWPFRLPKRLT